MAKIITNCWRKSKIASLAPKRTRLVGLITYSGQNLTFKLAGIDREVADFSVGARPNFRVHIKVAQLRFEAIRSRDTTHGSRHKNDGFMSANRVSATFLLISCPKRDFDGLRARNRRNHGEMVKLGHKIGEIMAELVNRKNGIDEVVAEIAAAAGCVQGFVCLREGGKGGRLARRGANKMGLVRYWSAMVKCGTAAELTSGS